MIISTDNDNNFSLTILLPGNSGARYETNVNVDCPNKDTQHTVKEHVSTMEVKAAMTSRVRVNTSEDHDDVQPEDFEFVNHSTLLMDGMNDLRTKEHLLDIKLWAEGKCFKAHRVVLSACSDYFRAMFTDPMRERTQEEIQLSGVQAQGLELVLDYIYTSKLSLTLANIQTVLDTATHLQVLQVIGACSGYLRNQLDLINCVDVISISETYSMPKLRKYAYNFISQKFMQMTHQQMSRLTLDQLDHLLGGDYPINATELSILERILEWLKQQKPQQQQQHSTDSKQTAEAAVTLLSRIDYGQLLADDMTSLQQRFSNLNFAQMLRDKISLCDISTQMRDKHGLLNLRGMQLCIVKVGGFGPHGITNQIAYFSPQRTWLPLTTIPHIECTNFGCTVLQNTLYVIGGCFNQTEAALTEHVHPFGFSYNPRRNEWNRIAPMNRERCRFTLTSVNDKLVAIGGCGNTDENLNDGDDQFMALEDFESSVELYDTNSDRWSFLPPLLNGGRSQHAACILDLNKVIISGGINSDLEVLDDTQILDLRSNEWISALKLPQPRADHVMIPINQYQILVIGGWTYGIENQRRLIDSIDIFDYQNGQWQNETNIPTPRFHSGVALVGEKLHIVGGFHSDVMFDRATGLVEIYDLKSKEWTKGSQSYPEDTWEHACVALHIPSCRTEDSTDLNLK